MKGGAWYSDARHLRPASRWPNPTGVGGNGVGFRVARDIVRVKLGTAAVQVQPDDVPAAEPVSVPPVQPSAPAPAPAGDLPREATVPMVPQPRSGEPARTQRRVERPLRDVPPKDAVKPQTSKRRSGARISAVR
jgi:hypothetical protein